MKDYYENLKEAVAYHGHICSGQAIGVRLAMKGLELLGIDDPKSHRDLIVYAETDRCITDAISTVCCCSMGRRRLKWVDYGKTAATFLNLENDEAYRVSIKGNQTPPDDELEMTEFWRSMDDDEMFIIQKVKVDIPECDKPGRPLIKATCAECDEIVLDGRHVEIDEKCYCKRCAGDTYYETL